MADSKALAQMLFPTAGNATERCKLTLLMPVAKPLILLGKRNWLGNLDTPNVESSIVISIT